jgi:hypothetical protein
MKNSLLFLRLFSLVSYHKQGNMQILEPHGSLHAQKNAGTIKKGDRKGVIVQGGINIILQNKEYRT